MKVRIVMLTRFIALRSQCLMVSLVALFLLLSPVVRPRAQSQRQSASLTGKIQPAGQTPISAARLTAKLYFPKEANRAALLTYSDANGYFKFNDLPYGKFLLEVYSGNNLLYQSEVNVSSSSTRIEIPLGRTDDGQVVVQYFPKVFDQAQLEGALQKLGDKYKIIRGKPEIGDTPTNAIFYGSNVSRDDVKAVARVLVDAGIKINAIKKFRTSTSTKARTIQIGSDRASLRAQVWDHNRLNSASSFDR
jgi:hypothetical protein